MVTSLKEDECARCGKPIDREALEAELLRQRADIPSVCVRVARSSTFCGMACAVRPLLESGQTVPYAAIVERMRIARILVDNSYAAGDCPRLQLSKLDDALRLIGLDEKEVDALVATVGW